MKNLFLSTLFLVSSSCLYAQTMTNSAPALAGIKTYELSEMGANSALTPIVPGISIYTPQWSKDVVNTVKDMSTQDNTINSTVAVAPQINAENNVSNEPITNSSLVSGQLNDMKAKNEKIMKDLESRSKNVPVVPNEITNTSNNTNVAPNAVSQNSKSINTKKRGQVLDSSVASTYTNQINSWNTSTISEFEKTGQYILETEYSKFLSQ